MPSEMRSGYATARGALGMACLALAMSPVGSARAQDTAAPSASPPPRIAVAPGALPEALAAAREGLAARVRLRLAAAKLALADAPKAASDATADPAKSCARAAAGASQLMLVDLRAAPRGLDVALRVYALPGCALVAAARANGDPTHLGVTLDAALARVLPGLGGSADALGAAPEMRVEDLGAESRALSALAGDELANAWRALDGDESPLAGELRARIDARASAPDLSAAERVRLHLARGEETAGDVSTRKLLTDAARALDGGEGPLDPRLMLAAGEIRLERGEADAARPYLEKAAELEPASADAQIGLGRCRALLGDDPGAHRALERAAELEPLSGRALEELAQLDAQDPAREAAALLRAGERAALGLDVHQALADYSRAAQLDAASAAGAREREASVYAALEEPEKARDSLRASISAGGPTAARLLGVARASRALGDAKEAEAAYRQALDLDANAPGAARELGALYRESGRSDEARPLLERAVARDDHDADAKLELARVLAGAKETDGALALLHAAELARGSTAAQLGLRAEIARAQGDVPGARAALTRAVELDPVDGALRLALADAAEAAGDAQGAALERERAALLADVSPDASPAGAPKSAARTNAPAEFNADLHGVDERLIALARSFPAIESESGRVIFVGVREARTRREALLDWLRLRVPDRDKIERNLRRVLAAQYPLMSGSELAKALENVATAGAVDALYEFESQGSLDASAAVELNLALGADALVLARLERHPVGGGDGVPTCGGDAPWRLQMRQLAGRSAPRARILGNATCLSPYTEEYFAWNPRAAGIYAGVALLALLLLARGWGAVVVTVELPPDTRALFSISVSRRPRKTAKTKSLKSREKAKWRIEDGLRRLNRFERPLREGEPTVFRWIPARRRPYFVTVRGPLTNAATGELIGDFLEEQRVRVQRGKRNAVKFDMRPKEVTLEILVTGAGAGAGHVGVALRGKPSSLRYVGNGPVFLYVKPGNHVVLVGAGDRLLERSLELKSFDPVRLLFDVARETNAVFSGSAAAVSAYLEGDVARAADELERAGQAQAATRIRAELMRARGDVAGASRALESAGDLRAAAELRAASDDRAGAAALYEAAEDFDKAADAYRAAGDLAAAARAYERAGELDDAIACCKETEDREYLLSLYEKNSSHFEAGTLARELRQVTRAIHALTQVDAIDPRRPEASRALVELHIERGQLPAALERLDELLEGQEHDPSALPLFAVRAELLEKLGRFDAALEAWEAIEARDASFQNAAARVAELRAKQVPPPQAGAATAPAESRYEIQEELGRGAMGVVYKARDKHLGRTVALKRLTESLRGHPTAVAYFEREARAAAALNHPNIVTIYDAGSENGQYFITMEFLQGTTLDGILRARGAMAAPIAAAIGMQVCAGLHYAHSSRIIHRDIKTANLFYTRERSVKIMDFGLAKMVEEVRKGATVIGGTPFYMAPEQASGERVDHRADLYALGVTLFELLTKTVPFRAGDVTFHHRNTPAPDPRERVASIPAAMAEIVVKLMQKRPEDRFQSAAEIAVALQPVATGG